ncbi:hypothetical protein JTB14_001255 [Gonioctena quinquepunctata]|nr:hypothetical protein JTB14_001255 [Gonioctena quinquepunctata]
MVYISEIDATVETEEVLVESVHMQQITVISRRPNFSRSQVATVAMQGKYMADKRCLEYGPHTTKCEGENRIQTCRNCGGESHQEKDCKEKPHCLTCKCGEHKHGQIKCLVFRKCIKENSLESQKTTGPKE